MPLKTSFDIAAALKTLANRRRDLKTRQKVSIGETFIAADGDAEFRTLDHVAGVVRRTLAQTQTDPAVPEDCRRLGEEFFQGKSKSGASGGAGKAKGNDAAAPARPEPTGGTATPTALQPKTPYPPRKQTHPGETIWTPKEDDELALRAWAGQRRHAIARETNITPGAASDRIRTCKSRPESEPLSPTFSTPNSAARISRRPDTSNAFAPSRNARSGSPKIRTSASAARRGGRSHTGPGTPAPPIRQPRTDRPAQPVFSLESRMTTSRQPPLAKFDQGQEVLMQAMMAIQEQNAVTIGLLERLIALVMPKDDKNTGSPLAEMFARMIAQQTAIIELSKQTIACVTRIGSSLTEPRQPEAVLPGTHRTC